ncbi:MAG: single-stranded DNA-binding protein [Clostridiales bacterium]|nr:single-stranded DNA-binding protein [Clostridiales bacterium]
MQQGNGSLTNNSAEIIGVIASELTFSHEVYGEGFYNFSVRVPRLSEAYDILPVTISDRLIDENIFEIGKEVHILGQIRSYNNYVESDKRNKLILTLFTREIELTSEPSAKNPNAVYLNGFICKTPVYRSTPFGREISDILIAVNRSYNKSDYIPCIAWGRNARFASRLNIGENIEIWGRMQSRNYQKKYDDGVTEEKTAYEISIAKLECAKSVERTPAENDD